MFKNSLIYNIYILKNFYKFSVWVHQQKYLIPLIPDTCLGLICRKKIVYLLMVKINIRYEFCYVKGGYALVY